MTLIALSLLLGMMNIYAGVTNKLFIAGERQPSRLHSSFLYRRPMQRPHAWICQPSTWLVEAAATGSVLTLRVDDLPGL